MRCFWIAACVVILGGPMRVHGVDEARMIRTTFSEVIKPARPAVVPTARAALERMDVVAEARSVQIDVKQGLIVDVTLSNRGTSAVDIVDPAEFLQVQMTDSRGYPVGLPPIPTGIRQPKRAGTSVEDSAHKDRKPYELIAVNGEATKPISDGSQTIPIVQLDPGKSRRLTLRIKKILANPAEYDAKLRQAQSEPARDRNTALDPPAVVAIPPGKYGVKLWISLVPVTSAADARQLETEPLSIRLAVPEK